MKKSSSDNTPAVGVTVVDAAQFSYNDDYMRDLRGTAIRDDPSGNVIDCRWTLSCSDDTLVPRVTFSRFYADDGNDCALPPVPYPFDGATPLWPISRALAFACADVRAWDGSPGMSRQIAEFTGVGTVPIVGIDANMTLQLVSNATDHRWAHGNHFTADFECILGTAPRTTGLMASVVSQNPFTAGVAVGASGVLLIGSAM